LFGERKGNCAEPVGIRNKLIINFVKTFTFTISSTCTVALSVTTCVAIANLSPNPIACAGRRRRFAEYNDEQGEDIGAQYPIIPSEVRM
jgi:hypothetical protein